MRVKYPDKGDPIMPFRQTCVSMGRRRRAGNFAVRPTVLALLLVLMLMARFAGAQDVFGRISGTVTDPSGAVVPGAKVSIVNEATQIRRVVTSDRNGYFAADAVPVG